MTSNLNYLNNVCSAKSVYSFDFKKLCTNLSHDEVIKGKARTSPDILEWFWVQYAHNFTHVLRPRSKNGAKHKNLNQKR